VLTLSCSIGYDDGSRVMHFTNVCVMSWIGDVVLWN